MEKTRNACAVVTGESTRCLDIGIILIFAISRSGLDWFDHVL
jgi:hypothetical protein